MISNSFDPLECRKVDIQFSFDALNRIWLSMDAKLRGRKSPKFLLILLQKRANVTGLNHIIQNSRLTWNTSGRNHQTTGTIAMKLN